MRIGPLAGSLSIVLLKPRKQRRINVSSLRHSKPLYSLSAPFKPTNNFGSVFTSCLDRGIYETKLPTHVSFFFYYFSYHFKRGLG